MRAVRPRNGAPHLPTADMPLIVATTITTDTIAAIMETDAAFHPPDVVTDDPIVTLLKPDSDFYNGFCIAMRSKKLVIYFCLKLFYFHVVLINFSTLHYIIIVIDGACLFAFHLHEMVLWKLYERVCAPYSSCERKHS